MKINYLKINGFGKLIDKEIKLNKSINLIYGKNEAGKTTFLKFLSGMFFGANKNKNGKDIADFDKYTPWNTEEFSGKAIYELDSGKAYEIFRNFKKKNPNIYNENKEDISKEFNIDKNSGNEFFLEQTGIDESLWVNTSLVEQQEVVLNGKSQNALTQKISNLLSSGDENTSYKKSIEKLNKKLIEEVGTERTTGRPLNILNEKINELKGKKELLEEYNEKQEILNKNKLELNSELNNKLLNIQLIKEIKEIKEEEILEKEKINIKNNIKKEYDDKIKELNSELKLNKNNKEIKSNINIFNLILITILITCNILINIINVNRIIEIALITGTIAFLIINLIILIRNKIKTKKLNIEEINQSNKVKREVEIINENKLKIEKEINELNLELMHLIKNKYNLIEIKYSKININDLIEINLEELNNKLESEKNNYDNLKYKINEIELEEKNIFAYLEKKSLYEEELISLEEEKEELLELEKIILIAKESLENAYEKIKDEITPKFTKDLSLVMEKISSGKYKNINFTDEYGLRVELENGEYVDGNVLSLGTIDQLYLSLRLSAIKEISNEKIPIILDETFVYYDDERLKNILKYLNTECSGYQIILLTCSKRESKILDELNIEYNFVEI